MVYYKHLYFLTFLLFLSPSIAMSENKIEHKIAVLVNEDIITSYDIIKRLKLTAIINNINLNAQNNQIMLNNIVDEIIREKLKIQKINEYNIMINDREYLDFETNFFQKNQLDKSETLFLLEDNKIPYSELKQLLKSELLWNKLINGLFYRLTTVSDLEIKEIIDKNPTITELQAENLVIQRQLDLQSSKLLRDIMNEATIEYK